MSLELDHLVVSAATLAAGAAQVKAQLGVAPAEGGAHPHMGTHNLLLGLGDIYLEVIAIDPKAPPPPHPRWFDLDHFAGPARLTNWVARCDDLGRAVARAPVGIGAVVALSRGELRWQMAVPEDGRLPCDGVFPALIAWQGTAHPARMLPDCGLRLRRLTVFHPAAAKLRATLAGQLCDPRVAIRAGPTPGLRAEFDTPAGRRILT